MKTLLTALTALGICAAGVCQIHYKTYDNKQEITCIEKREHCHSYDDTNIIAHLKHCNH